MDGGGGTMGKTGESRGGEGGGQGKNLGITRDGGKNQEKNVRNHWEGYNYEKRQRVRLGNHKGERMEALRKKTRIQRGV